MCADVKKRTMFGSFDRNECIEMAGNLQFSVKWQLKFIAMIVFTACLFAVKVTVGRLMNSTALVADSFHMVSDFAALTIGYLALRLANSKTNRGKVDLQKFTFGWIRAEVLGGLINTVFLFALCFSVFISSLKRFVIPERITNPKPVLIVGCASLFINFIGLFMFRESRDNICQCCFRSKRKPKTIESRSLIGGKAKKRKGVCRNARVCGSSYRGLTDDDPTWQKEFQTPHSLNVRGVYLHILEHFLASFVVICSALVAMYINASWVVYVDPGCTILLVILILYSTVPLFRETIILFMQSVPANLKVQDMKEGLLRTVPAVLSVHEFHVWHLGGDQVVASAHILFEREEDYEESVETIKAFFRNEGIACMTFQPEFFPRDSVFIGDMNAHNVCYYRCENCSESTCCSEQHNHDNVTIDASLNTRSRSLTPKTSESDASIN